jgi:hypothetical protein
MCFMRDSMDFRLDPRVRVDRTVLDQVLNYWYQAIARQGGIPAPGSLPMISPELRTRYCGGVADLLARVATTTGMPVAELYRVNRGRIPPWAWHRPYARVRGIATPIPEMLRPAPGTPAIRFSLRGVAVTILPDGFDPAMLGRAETRSNWSWQAPGCQYTVGRGGEGAGVVTAISPVTPPAVTIQTFYCRDAPPDGLAGYGRGSTKEDVAGAAVHPWSATVAFHEGQHGMDCFDFLKEEQVPHFEGRAGMTVAQFRAACEQFSKAWTSYQTRASEFSRIRTDDVGAATGRRPHLTLRPATPAAVASPRHTPGPASVDPAVSPTVPGMVARVSDAGRFWT